mgnify:CR=1 FL=1
MLAKSRFGLCCVVAATLCIAACDSAEETSAGTSAVRPVKLINAGEAEATQVSQFPAVIGANRLSELSFQVGGMLKELPIKESQRLNRGDLIGKLDQRDLKSALDAAKAQFQSAEAEYQRAVRLAKEDAIAGNVLDQRKTQFDVSKAQFDQTEKALADSVLHAPFNGVVAQKLVKTLQTVSPGQVVVNFMSADSLEAAIDLPASFLANIPKDESSSNDRQAFVILDSAPNQLIKAEFKEASLIADTASQTYAITFAFRPPENLLVLPGMNATVELRIESQAKGSRVAVPLDAVTSDGQNTYVWTVDQEAMTVSKRAVTIEDGVGDTVVVIAGLNKSDTIVGAGAAYLSEGMKIREWK